MHGCGVIKCMIMRGFLQNSKTWDNAIYAELEKNMTRAESAGRTGRRMRVPHHGLLARSVLGWSTGAGRGLLGWRPTQRVWPRLMEAGGARPDLVEEVAELGLMHAAVAGLAGRSKWRQGIGSARRVNE